MQFWKDKKVFITGHTGFKGSWLIIIMNFFGARVYGISFKPKNNSLFKFSKSKYKNLNPELVSSLLHYFHNLLC